MAESSNHMVEALMGLVQAQLMDVNTCLPATIVSYENGRARVAPSVKKRYADGDVLDFPIVPGVRVLWPSFAGGAAGVKGPVNPGDKCLLVVAQQAVDGSDDRRMFDLSDAYCIMCDLGGAVGAAAKNDDMTVFYGGASVSLSKAGKVTITAPGGLEMVTPATTNTGTLTTDGLLTYKAGLTGTGTGTVSNMTVDGVNVKTHTHSGVSSGPSNTGAPN